MNYAARQAALENASYILDSRNHTHGWPKGFDEATMTLTVEVSLYLTRREAVERGLPTPEEYLGDAPSWHNPEQLRRRWNSETLQYEDRADGEWSLYNNGEWVLRSLPEGFSGPAEPAYLYEEVEVEVRAIFEVCGTCDGKGSHVNPSIDCGGLSREDFDEDPDFAEDYFSGRHDVTCNACRGRRVYPTIAPDVDPVIVKALDDRARDEAAYRAECAAEARMGC